MRHFSGPNVLVSNGRGAFVSNDCSIHASSNLESVKLISTFDKDVAEDNPNDRLLVAGPKYNALVTQHDAASDKSVDSRVDIQTFRCFMLIEYYCSQNFRCRQLIFLKDSDIVAVALFFGICRYITPQCC